MPVYSPEYMSMHSFCGDNAISRIICQPSAKYTYTTAKSMCKAYRDGQLHNLKMNVGTTVASLEVAELKWYATDIFGFQ